jgi:hypothetical protein
VTVQYGFGGDGKNDDINVTKKLLLMNFAVLLKNPYCI